MLWMILNTIKVTLILWDAAYLLSAPTGGILWLYAEKEPVLDQMHGD